MYHKYFLCCHICSADIAFRLFFWFFTPSDGLTACRHGCGAGVGNVSNSYTLKATSMRHDPEHGAGIPEEPGNEGAAILLPPADLEKLVAQLMRHEGAMRDKKGRHKAYRCSAGALTIGYGHNLDAHPIPGLGAVSFLNESEARSLLLADLARHERRLREALPFARALEPVRYAVLVNMAFNLGLRGVLAFKNTLADVERGDYTAAARRMLRSAWARQTGGRARELARQMAEGAWV